MKADDFINQLHSQMMEPKGYVDARIMAKINRWRIKNTPSYKCYVKNGGSDIGYLSHMFARAGVDKDTAKFFISNISGLSGSMDDFESEYANTEFEEKFRVLGGGFDQNDIK